MDCMSYSQTSKIINNIPNIKREELSQEKSKSGEYPSDIIEYPSDIIEYSSDIIGF